MNRQLGMSGRKLLYRSDHEEILHKLITLDKRIPEDFASNVRVRGASGKNYEVDLWSQELRLALEVDGAHHVSNANQRNRDIARDLDLKKRPGRNHSSSRR